MQKTLTIVFIASLCLWGCKKDSPAPPPKTMAECYQNDQPRAVKFASWSSGTGASIDVFRNGMLALQMYDSLKIYDRELRNEVLAMPSRGKVMCLSDNTFLTMATGYEVTYADTSGGPISAWKEVGRNGNCERVYVRGESYVAKGVMEAVTHVRRYDLQGNKLFDVRLKGLASVHDKSVVEHNGHLYFGLGYRDSVLEKLVMHQGMFQDTVRRNSESGKFILHKLRFNGNVVWAREVEELVASYPGSFRDALFGKSGQNFWFITEAEFLQLDLNGKLVRKNFHVKAQCAESILKVMGLMDGLHISSRHYQSGEYFSYVLEENHSVRDMIVPLQGESLIAVDGNELFVASLDEIYSIDPAPHPIVPKGSLSFGLQALTVKRGCDGSFYGLTTSQSGDYYIVKINSKGEAPVL